MQEIERSAASVEEAVETALAELGLTEQEAEVQVVQEPRSGFLGIASQPAIVRVRPRERPVAAEAADGQAETARVFLEGLADAMDMDVDVEVTDVEGQRYVDLWAVEGEADDMGLLIGKHGHTLDALQDLVRTHVQRETGERCVILVDVEDYRKRRVSRVARHARDAARRVKKSGRAEALEPMTAYERKVVHDAVSRIGGLETESEGEEPDRRVVIRPRR